MGHELRDPLGAISNAAYFLNMVLEEPEPAVREALEIVRREVARSERIVVGLLDFGRLGTTAVFVILRSGATKNLSRC